MIQEVLKPLFVMSLQTPRLAAERILGLGLTSQALWMALSLVSVVTSLVMSMFLQAVPLPNDEMGRILASSPGMDSPLILAILQWGRIVLSVFVFFWIGRLLGGTGELTDVLAVVTWLQVMSFTLMTGITLLGIALPILSPIAMLIFICWWLFSLVTYVDVAHGFANMMKATGVIVISVIGVLVGMTFFMGFMSALFATGVGGN